MWIAKPAGRGSEALPARAIPLRAKLLFWLLLGALSVFFAEIVSGSSSYAFFTAWGLLAVLPLYGLHTVFLAWLVYRASGPVTLPGLFLAGAIFGLYEAYITKVLWDPTWGGHGFSVGGLYVTQTAVLMLYWHPLMAFIAPIVVGETLFSTSREAVRALPDWLTGFQGNGAGRVRFAAAFGVFCGISKALNAQSPLDGVASLASGVAVLFGLAFLWRRTGCGGTQFRDLLPSGRQAAAVGALLVLLYVVMGVGVRPEALPRTLLPHLSVWALYVALFALFLLVTRQQRRLRQVEAKPVPQIRLRHVTVYLASFALALVLATSVKPLTTLAVLLTWAAGVAAGTLLLGQAVWVALPRHSPG